MRIRAARVTEFPTLQAIERAAGLMFCDIGMPEIAQYDPWPLPVMAAHQDAGRWWVAANDGDEPVAYLIRALLMAACRSSRSPSTAAAPAAAWRALLDHAANRAAADSLPALTLTTFAHVPWNAPYYARCGFRVLDDAEVTPGLQAIRGAGSRDGRRPVATSMHAPRPLRPRPGAKTRRQCPRYGSKSPRISSAAPGGS